MLDLAVFDRFELGGNMGQRQKPSLFTPAITAVLDKREKATKRGSFVEMRDLTRLGLPHEVEAAILSQLKAHRWLKPITLLDRIEKKFELSIVKSAISHLLVMQKIELTSKRKFRIAS